MGSLKHSTNGVLVSEEHSVRTLRRQVSPARGRGADGSTGANKSLVATLDLLVLGTPSITALCARKSATTHCGTS